MLTHCFVLYIARRQHLSFINDVHDRLNAQKSICKANIHWSLEFVSYILADDKLLSTITIAVTINGSKEGLGLIIKLVPCFVFSQDSFTLLIVNLLAIHHLLVNLLTNVLGCCWDYGFAALIKDWFCGYKDWWVAFKALRIQNLVRYNFFLIFGFI